MEVKKQSKYAAPPEQVLRKLEELTWGWVEVVFLNGSSKRVRGLDQAGYGGVYGNGSPKSFVFLVPVGVQAASGLYSLPTFFVKEVPTSEQNGFGTLHLISWFGALFDWSKLPGTVASQLLLRPGTIP